MKTIFLALALLTATSCLPAQNIFLAEHEANAKIYNMVPGTVAALVGAILVGIHVKTAKNVHHSLNLLKRFDEFNKKLPKGSCPACLEDNIPVIQLHNLHDPSFAQKGHAYCVNCLRGQRSSGRSPSCPTCRAPYSANPLIDEALAL